MNLTVPGLGQNLSNLPPNFCHFCYVCRAAASLANLVAVEARKAALGCHIVEHGVEMLPHCGLASGLLWAWSMVSVWSSRF